MLQWNNCERRTSILFPTKGEADQALNESDVRYLDNWIQ